METNTPKVEQRLAPCLSYDDAPAAIQFLCAAFGFEERFRLPMPGGRIGHAELAYEGHTVMLATSSELMGFVSPRRLRGVHAQIHVEVDDVDALYVRAKAAGATIATAPQDRYGSRNYRAMDPEGHRWIFAMPLNEISGNKSGTCDGTTSRPLETAGHGIAQ